MLIYMRLGDIQSLGIETKFKEDTFLSLYVEPLQHMADIILDKIDG